MTEGIAEVIDPIEPQQQLFDFYLLKAAAASWSELPELVKHQHDLVLAFGSKIDGASLWTVYHKAC